MPEHKRVTLKSGGEYSFAKLIIATGARPRRLNIPGADLRNLNYLRMIDDSKIIRSAVEKAKHAVVIGGGFIGMEVAAVLAQKGVSVAMVLSDDRISKRLFSPGTSNFFEAYYVARGVRLMKSTAVSELRGDGVVSSAVLANDQTIPCELVVAGIGVQPATEPRRRRDYKNDVRGRLHRAGDRSVRRSPRTGASDARDISLRQSPKTALAEDARACDRAVPESAGTAAQRRRLHEARGGSVCERCLSFTLHRRLSRHDGTDSAPAHQDRAEHNAMAARGYWQAYQVVEKSIARVLQGENPGVVAEEDHRTWYREMFALMNLMMAAGGYPWTVIPVADRKPYMESLEKASIGEDIEPFTDLLAGLVEKAARG
jgi:hypothetical protein